MGLRLITAGESHGPGLTCIVEGLPAGLELDQEDLDRDMARRQLGHGRGGRMKIEKDAAAVTAGVRHGRTLGGPDRAPGRQPRLRQLGGADEPVAGRGRRARGAPAAPRPRRPGRDDEVRPHRRAQRPRARERPRDRGARGRRRAGAGRSCARSASRSAPTSCRSARCARRGASDLTAADFAGVDESPVRCLDADASAAMVEEINRLRKANESLGGVFEVRAFGLVPGPRLARLLGGAPRRPPRPGDPLDPGAEGRERRGRPSRSPGSPAPRPTTRSSGREERGYYRETNRAGGLEGGMTTGEPLVVQGAMKPLPTLTKPLRSVDIATREPAEALRERTDSATIPAAGVVGEAMVALRARRRLPAQVRRRPHRRRARERRRLRAPHRLEAEVLNGTPEPGPERALVFIGFMGAGKTSAARTAGSRARRRAGGRRRRARARAGDVHRRSSSSATASPPSARPRSAWWASCSTAPTAA